MKALVVRRAFGILVAAAVLLCVTPGAAGEEGTFTVLRSFIRDYASLEFAGGTVTAGSLNGTSSVLESSGAPFEAGTHGLVTCLVYAKRAEGMLELDASCSTSDASAESWYALSRRSEGDVAAGGGGAGRWSLMGGTGKYSGLDGKCTYETSYLGEERVVTVARCAWHRP